MRSRTRIGSRLGAVAIVFLLAAFAEVRPPARAQSFERYFPAKDLTTVGVYYYPEH